MLSRENALIYCLIVCLVFGVSGKAWAIGSSGFENASYSAESLAQGNAMVARPDDPDAVVWNPAGLPYLKNVQYSGSLAGINTFTFFTSKATGDHEKNTPQLALVPTNYLTVNPGKYLGNRFGFGLGTTVPFGLANRYHSIGNLAQYTGYHNSLRMIAVTVAGGMKLTDNLSVGAGAVDYITYKYAQIFNFPNSFLLSGAVPGNTFADGLARTDTRGYGWGWTLGALAKPFKHHHLGFYYRSRATVDVNGNVKIEGINPLLAGTFPNAPLFQTGVHSEIPLPSNITLAYAYVPSDKWSAEFDLGLTQWHVFKDQDFGFDNPNNILTALGTIPKDFHDTWSFHLGGHYRLNKKIDLMGGSFFYTAASPKFHTTNVIPDSNRIAGTLGFRWDMFENASLDVAYLAMLYTRRSVANPTVFAKTGLSIDGRYTSFTQEFMVTFTYRFDKIPFLGNSKKETAEVTDASRKS